MANPEKNEGESEVSEAIKKIQTGAKVAAFTGLGIVATAAKVVSAGATTVKVAATKARNNLLK